MAQHEDFLVEIGTEELPPKALKRLGLAFRDAVASGLADAELVSDGLLWFATPRRLAVFAPAVTTRQADRQLDLRGPPEKVAFDGNGEPTKAALSFAAKCGVTVADLQRLETDKGTWLVHRAVETGQPASALLPGIVAQALDKLPIPKRMRWGSGNAEFVRPVHWVVMMLGSDVIDTTVLGIPAGNTTYGHRFHAPAPLQLDTAQEYAGRLEQDGQVIANFETRATMVRAAVESAAQALGGEPVGDDALFEEVTALVEWPVPVSASFDPRFLGLPEEVLIETLQAHQRYFPVRDACGTLVAKFITVSNIDSRDPEQVRLGNERVVEPRLADAAFFYDSDKRVPLADRIGGLKRVVFQKKLGTLYDKMQRVETLAGWLAERIGGDVDRARRAAQLAKCDLLTEMVGEFPALQGTMGRYYASLHGERADVASAMQEQYLPRFAGDELPQTITGSILAVADRIDTIVGIFAIGQRPSGTRDPFALRRGALGVLRILIEIRLDVDLPALIAAAAQLQPVQPDQPVLCNEVYQYLIDRLRAYYLDGAHPGITAQMFDAVAARTPDSPLDFHDRILAVRDFAALDAATSLAAANKRIANILRTATDQIPETPDNGLLTEPAEQALHKALGRAQQDVMPLLEKRQYSESLTRLAGLRPAIDRFFDDVMVMTDDEAVRVNRLALLRQLRELFLRTADLSRLQV